MKILRFESKRTVILVVVLITASFLFSLFPAHAGPGEVAKEAPRPPIRLGVITLYHPLVMYRKYQPFADYLTNTTPHVFELKISESYVQIIDGLREGTIDAALLGGLTYLEASRETELLPLVSALGQDGKPTCRGAFITRDDNPDIHQLSDIKGKRFAFASAHSTSGNLMPLDYLYTKTDVRLEDFYSHDHLKYHDSVVREVLRGNFDAGVALDTIVRQYESAGLRVLGQTGPFPGFVLAVRKDLSPRTIDAIRETLLALDPNNADHQIMMSTWDINIRFGFAPGSDRRFDCVRRAYDRINKTGIQWR